MCGLQLLFKLLDLPAAVTQTSNVQECSVSSYLERHVASAHHVLHSGSESILGISVKGVRQPGCCHQKVCVEKMVAVMTAGRQAGKAAWSAHILFSY